MEDRASKDVPGAAGEAPPRLEYLESMVDVVESLGLLAVHVDAAGTIVFANESCDRLLGQSVVGCTFSDLLTGEAKEEASAAFEARLADREAPGSLDVPVLAADGMVHVIRWNMTSLQDPSGGFAGVVSIGEDVTEQVGFEGQIARKAEEFDAIFRLSRDLFFRLDADGVVVGYNAPSADALPVPSEVFMNRPYADVLPPDLVAIVRTAAAECHETGEVVVVEHPLTVGGQVQAWEARFLPLGGEDTAVIVREVTVRKQRAAQLRESEERYRTLVELAPYAIYVVGLDDTVLYCNDAAASLLGARSRDHLIGMCITHLLPASFVAPAKQDEDRVIAAVARMKPGDPPPVSGSMKATTLTLDGREIDIERTIAGIFYRGQPALLILARDIAQELEVQRAASESRDFSAKLLEMLDSGVVVVDSASRTITRANRIAETLFGYEPDEMLGKSTRQIHVSQEAFERFNANVDDALDPGELHTAELVLARKDGSLFDAELSVRSLSGPEGFRIGVIRDISDRKAAERMIRESEERLRAIVEAAPFGMHFYRLEDDRLIYTGYNPAAQQILGMNHESRVGKPIGEAFPELEERGLADIYRRIALEGGSWHSEQLVHDDSGMIGAYEVTAFQVLPGRVAVAFNDVLDRKTSELRERRYLQRLSALAAALANAEDAERRRLAEDLHDRVSQTLAVAMMHLRAAEPSEGSECNVHELSEGRLLLENAIQETRAITTELFPPVLQELGLGVALQWLCEETERNHALRCQVGVDESAAKGLTSEGRNVLFRGARELLVNCVKHARASQVTVSFAAVGPYAELVVEDDGVGFDVERVAAGGSPGFGLFSIRERVPHMGGEFEIHSTPGDGTRAILRLPHAADRD